MAIEFGSRRETFENYKVYETMLLWDGAVHELRRENQPKLPTAYGLSEDE